MKWIFKKINKKLNIFVLKIMIHEGEGNCQRERRRLAFLLGWLEF